MKLSDIQAQNDSKQLFDALTRLVNRGGRHRFPSSGDLALRLARIAVEMGDGESADAAFRLAYDAATSSAEAFEPAINIAMRESSLGFVERKFPSLLPVLKKMLGGPELISAHSSKHIAICGVSFCGSTLLDRLLGSMPEVKSIGESHWLSECRDFGIPGSRARPIDWTDPESNVMLGCWVCGKKCQVLSYQFRSKLSAFRSNWYQKIAHQLTASALVSSDKNFSKYANNDPKLRYDSLILAKSPKLAWKSHRDNGRIQSPKYESEIIKYLDRWSDEYNRFLKSNNNGRKVVLIFDDLISDPRNYTELLCKELGLEFDENGLKRPRLSHAIGGNGRAANRLKSEDFFIDSEILLDLSKKEINIIENHKKSMETMNLITDLSIG